MTTAGLFSTDPGKIMDFSGKRGAEIFNESVVPQVNSFLDLLGEDPAGLDEAKRRRDENTSRQMQDEMFAAQEDEDFIQQFRAKQQASLMENDEDPVASYNPKPPADLPQPNISLSKEDVVQANAGEFNKVKLKLANYGYDSDSSPDYNSNVLKIGHANNKLVDGRSAALTKSLAKRYGLKTGDEFEILTANGEVMVRTYDDTVPTKYKGKPLPETVDLYETNGSNSFGGTVVGIRKRSKNPNSRSLDLVSD
jgi:hypothetical protein